MTTRQGIDDYERKIYATWQDRRRQSLRRLQTAIKVLSTMTRDAEDDRWWVSRCRTALDEMRHAHDLIAGFGETDDLLDELASL